MIRVVPVSVLLVATLGLGCASEGVPASEPVEPSEPSTPEDPARTLTELERRLQDANRVEIAFETESEGAVASQLKGTLVWSRDGELRLSARGEFAGRPQTLEVRADATTLEVRVGGESRHSGPRPAKLAEAVVLGLLRQGVLHNLAMATAGQPPSFADGGFDGWMRTIEHRRASADTLEFDIEVEGQNIAHATLQLDADGLPRERRQTVEFPEGQMRVVERYTKFVAQ
jgi:hypothetical protein